MKKITLFLAMALATLSVSAQGVKVGAEAGYDCVIETVKMGGYKGSGSINGFHVGPVFHFGFSENLGIKSGLLYHYAADGVKVLGEKTSTRMHTLQIPVQFAYTYNFSDNFGIYGFAGPKFDIGIALFDRTKDSDGKVYKYNDYTGKAKYDGEDVSGEDPEGAFKRFDVKFGFGVGVNFLKNFYGQFEVDFGLLNRLKKSKDKEESLKISLDDLFDYGDYYYGDDDYDYDYDYGYGYGNAGGSDAKTHFNAIQLSLGYYF